MVSRKSAQAHSAGATDQQASITVCIRRRLDWLLSPVTSFPTGSRACGLLTLRLCSTLNKCVSCPHCWRFGAGIAVACPNKLSSKPKIQEEARFQLLRLLHENPELSQRELGERVGVSLGAVNYCLKSLVEVGFIKVGRFVSNQNKLGYAYMLTPSGIAEKVRLTGRFLARKRAEFEALRGEIDALSREITE